MVGESDCQFFLFIIYYCNDESFRRDFKSVAYSERVID